MRRLAVACHKQGHNDKHHAERHEDVSVQAVQSMYRHLYAEQDGIQHDADREQPIGILRLFQQPILCGENAKHKEQIEVTAIQQTEVIFRLCCILP